MLNALITGRSFQYIIRIGARQETYRSLLELCMQDQSDTREFCHSQSVQVGRVDGNI